MIASVPEILKAFDFAISQKPDAELGDLISATRDKLVADKNMRNALDRFQIIDEVKDFIKDSVIARIHNQRYEGSYATEKGC